MSFAAPGVLALLAVLLPAIVLLHTLRREEHATASLFLWSKVPSRRQGARRRRSVPWRSALLWLHLATATVAVLALAGPTVAAGERPDHLIVLLDGSRTMRTADVAPSRFGAAVGALADAWQRADGGPRVSLIVVADDARLVAARQPVGPDLVALLGELEASDTAPAWEKATELARSLLRAGEASEVWVLSDGQGGPGSVGDLDVQQARFGGPYVNVGVAQVDVVPRGTARNRWTVTGEIRTVGLQRGDVVRVQVFFRPDGSDTPLPWSGADVEIGRGGVGAFELAIDLPGDGVLEVRTGGLDQRPADDVVRRVIWSDASVSRIAWVGPEDPALIAALLALGDVELYAFENMPDADVAADYDLVIATRAGDDPVAASVLWYGSPPERFLAAGDTIGGDATLDDPVAAAPGHPLMRDVDPREMDIRTARPLAVPAGAQALIEADGAALAWARTTEHGRQVALGFGPGESAWPSQLSFPVFVASLVEWARSAPVGAVAACQVGTPCSLPKEAYGGTWTLRDEDGAIVARPAPRADADDAFADHVWIPGTFERAFVPARAGLYELRFESGPSRWLAVDAPFAGDAPDDVPATTEAMSTDAGAATGAAAGLAAPSGPASVAAWRWLASLALVLLAVDAVLAVRGLRSSLSARSRSGRATALWSVALLALATTATAMAVALVPTVRFPASATRVVLWPAAGPDGGTSAGTPAADRLRDRVLGWRTVDATVGVTGTSEDGDDGGARSATLAQGVDLARALHAGGPGPLVVDARALPERDVPVLAASDLLRFATTEPAQIVLWEPAPSDSGATSLAVLRSVEVPAPPRAGGAFELVVRLSPQDRATVLEIVDEAGQLAAREPVAAGDRVVRTRVEAGEVGRQVVTVRLLGEGGDGASTAEGPATDAPAIDEADVVVNVTEPLDLLFVASSEEDGALLAAALEAQQVRITRVAPNRIPATLERLSAYDAVLVADVPASEIHPFFQDMLQQFVRDRGGGLIFTGGTRSFGPGGYYSTVLDDVSPLSSRIQEDAPEVAMTFVLDRSGSMDAVEGDATRLDLAKLATFEAIRLLGERSQAALVAFDTVATTLLPLRSTATLGPFRTGLQAIVAGGGTSIYPALVEAYDVVAASDAATRHVIVLTDGLSEEGDFEEILGRIRGLGVNTSFVGVGDAASRGQLTRLAGYGGGSLHFTSNARALPGILAQEALMLSADPIEEGPTPTAWVGGAPPEFLGEDVRADAPTFLGYVQTTAKDEATVLLEGTSSGDPLLATWRYGLGRVAAFATEADGPWSGEWTRQDDFATFWSQLVRWSALTVPSDPYRLDVAPRERVVDVALDLSPDLAVDVEAGGPPVAELVAGLGGTDVLASAVLAREAPTRWAARLPLPAPDGAGYVVRVRPAGEGAWDEPIEIGFTHAAPSWSRASSLDVVPVSLVASGLEHASADENRATVTATALPFLPPRVTWHGPSRDWLIVSLVAFALSLVVRFGGLSLRRSRVSR